MSKRVKLSDRLKDENLRRLLDEKVGSPISLTREQALAIVDAGAGGRPDLPSGSEHVHKINKLWRGLARLG